VMKRASAPLKALFEFREASCMAKRDQFARLAEQGDDRALFELNSLHEAECRRRRDPCCFNDNRALAQSIRALKARLASAAANAAAAPPVTSPAPPPPTSPTFNP
jgi:eukaryotic-like serine/threonine-protein kinase